MRLRRRPVEVFNDPELVELLKDDPELLAIADAIAQTQQPRPSRRRRTLLLAAAFVIITVLIAVPALAAFTDIINFGAARRAPQASIIRFTDLDRQAPAGMAPNVIADKARKLELTSDRTRTTIVLAPTSDGGYCYELDSPKAMGCNAKRSIPFDVGVAAADASKPATAYGAVLDPRAVSVELRSGTEPARIIRLTRVSQPIDASFFAATLPPVGQSLPLTATARDANGRALATRVIPRAPSP